MSTSEVAAWWRGLSIEDRRSVLILLPGATPENVKKWQEVSWSALPRWVRDIVERRRW